MIVYSEFKISYLVPLGFGILFGFMLMVFIAAFIVKLVIKKKNPDIRQASIKAFESAKKQKTWPKRIMTAMMVDSKEVVKTIYKNTKYPLYELSINEIVGGLKILHNKLDLLIDSPLMIDLKKIKLNTILTINDKIIQPSLKTYNNKVVKVLLKIWSIIFWIINIINPVAWIKRIMNWTIFRNGKKDFVYIALDVFGSNVYQIYSQNKKNEEKIEVKEEVKPTKIKTKENKNKSE